MKACWGYRGRFFWNFTLLKLDILIEFRNVGWRMRQKTWSPTYWGRHAIYLKHLSSIIIIYSNNWTHYQKKLEIIAINMPIFRFIFMFLTPWNLDLKIFICIIKQWSQIWSFRKIDLCTLNKHSYWSRIAILVFLVPEDPNILNSMVRRPNW